VGVKMVLLPYYFLDLTVAIGNPIKEWVGTGFLYGNQNRSAIYLVTNQHVLEDIHEKYEQIIIRFNDETSSKDFYVNLGTKDTPTYFNHPDKAIDISIIKDIHINSVDDEVEIKKLKIGAVVKEIRYTIKQMEDIPIREGDFIYVIGFPMGMDSITKKSPIVRTGCIARINDIYNKESNQFLLDAFVFPANSRSPVILKPEAIFFEGYGSGVKEARLIGIVNSYESYKETLVTENKAEFRSVSVQNAGLAKVYPVDFINETITAYEKGFPQE
jgi:hypothetical protein